MPFLIYILFGLAMVSSGTKIVDKFDKGPCSTSSTSGCSFESTFTNYDKSK